jgi:Rrf2 family protein
MAPWPTRRRSHAIQPAAQPARQILQSLAQSGIIEAHKGSGGGYRMIRNPTDVTLAQVFESIEGPVHMVMCTSNDGCCSIEDRCTVKNGLTSLKRSSTSSSIP